VVTTPGVKCSKLIPVVLKPASQRRRIVRSYSFISVPYRSLVSLLNIILHFRSLLATSPSLSLSLYISLQDICQSGRRTRPSAGAVIGQRGRPTRTMRVAVRSSWGQNLYRRRRGAELDRGLWQERRPTCGRNSGQRCSLGAVARERSTQEARALH
jgi:hypothetical protein